MSHPPEIPLLWRSLPPPPGLDDTPKPPYTGDPVLLLTPEGAVEAFAILRKVHDRYQVFWDIPEEVDPDGKFQQKIAYWSPAPIDPDRHLDAPWKNPEPEPGNSYLIQVWYRWVEATFLKPDPDHETWLVGRNTRIAAVSIEFWHEAPQKPEVWEMRRWREQIRAESDTDAWT
jgi:hypothetical protein